MGKNENQNPNPTPEMEKEQTTQEFLEMSQEEYNKQILKESLERLNLRVKPFKRLAVLSLLDRGYCDERDLDDLLKDVAESQKNQGWLDKKIDELSVSNIGLVACPTLLKVVRWVERNIDYKTSEEQFEAEYERKMMTKLLDRLK